MKFFGTLLAVLLLWSVEAQGADHAVVLLYHHVSTETPPSTSVTPQTFQQHLNYLADNGYRVLSLSQILNTLLQEKEVPDKTVAITFDDAYRSVLDNALPLLEKKQWPFTVFVSTQAIDRGYTNYLGWPELRKLLAAGAEIGNHSHTHNHLVRQKESETPKQWAIRVREDIMIASRKLQEELDVEAKMFAYPYGEYTPELKEIVAGLRIFGIAQQSGVVGFGTDRLAVPRFPMATNYADMKRFVIAIQSKPLPVIDDEQGPVVLRAGQSNKYHLDFTLRPGEYQVQNLACYSSSGERLTITTEEKEETRRTSISLPKWQAGRHKINCTAPSLKGSGEYFWHSWQWLVKEQDGQWYRE